MPLYRSRAIAAAAGLRAAAYLVLASGFFVLAGWPSAEVSLSLVALVIGLGAVSPNPQGFTVAAFIAAPIAAVLAGTLEFLILDGVTEFPLLALALAPFVIGTMVVATRPRIPWSPQSLGRLSLIFILVILSPSNPQSYDVNSFLFVVLFLCTGIGLLLATQTLIPPESIERRQRWIMASVRRDFELALSKHDRRLAPEEAMFRDAARIGQIMAGETSPRDSKILAEALSYFDRAAAIQLGRESMARLPLPPHLLVKGSEKDIAQQRRDDPALRGSPWSCILAALLLVVDLLLQTFEAEMVRPVSLERVSFGFFFT